MGGGVGQGTCVGVSRPLVPLVPWSGPSFSLPLPGLGRLGTAVRPSLAQRPILGAWVSLGLLSWIPLCHSGAACSQHSTALPW